MGSIALGDLANIKLKLNITDGSQDVYLGDLNDQISAEIEQFVFGENVLGFRTGGGSPVDVLVEYHDGGFHSIVTRRDISDVTATRDLVALTENGITLTQGTEYHLDAHPSRTLRRLDGADNFRAVFASGRRNIKVTYTGESLNPPADIVRVAEEETARAYLAGHNDSTDGGNLVVSQRSPDAGDSITYRSSEFSEQSLRIMRTHRDGSRFF